MNFDTVYGIMLDLLDTFYPEREITVTLSDPPYITPTVKALLRRKNRLMHAAQTDEAGATTYRHHTQQHAVAAHYRHPEERQKCLGESA